MDRRRRPAPDEDDQSPPSGHRHPVDFRFVDLNQRNTGVDSPKLGHGGLLRERPMAIPIKLHGNQPRAIEERLEALEHKRPFIPPGELREFDEFVVDLRDTIEILRRDLVNRRLTMSYREAPGTVTPPARYALDPAERVPENAIWAAAVRLGLTTSLAMFLVLSSPILLDQWISGQGSVLFMLGTLLVLLG